VIVAFQVIIFELSVSVGIDVGDCGISSNYFQTLCEMPMDIYPSVRTSVIVAFQVFIFMLQNISSMIYNYFK